MSYIKLCDNLIFNNLFIVSINTNLSNNSFTKPTPMDSKISVVYGGYVQIGKMVVVNMRLKTTSAISGYIELFNNMPQSSFGDIIATFGTNKSGLIGWVYNNKLGLTTNGATVSTIQANTEFIVSGIYICN